MPIAGSSNGVVGRERRFAVLAGVLALGVALLLAGPAVAEDFPLRDKYASVGVAPVETEELAASLDAMAVVDARSPYEYATLHIRDAVSIPLAARDFDESVRTLAEKSGQPLVFYCNGVTCAVSYKAALKAKEAGVAEVRVYDAGVFAWAQTHPEHTVLLGEPLQRADRLIADEAFKSRVLDEDAFYARIQSSTDPVIVDIRSKDQRQGVSLFQMQDRHVPLTIDNQELGGLVQAAITEKRPMFFVDATGKQVRWLQYYLEEQGATQYWFLEGGASQIFESMGLQ
ncbi:rhodanese-like domain-containing protein [Guyparkeria halopsychrophila]|uniref:rhodanese-like domain-containing protein n=1 Tax=Guyparkeria halopsychrophila TaxID=3139421 RepID=UPI0037C8A5CC